jgi:hypothetical protein
MKLQVLSDVAKLSKAFLRQPAVSRWPLENASVSKFSEFGLLLCPFCQSYTDYYSGFEQSSLRAFE